MKANPWRKNRQMMHMADESQLKLENHGKSRDIKNPWNCFLMEVKLILDYYIKEVISTSSRSQQTDPNFFNFIQFQSRFMPIVEEKYKISAPAIMNFFRHRFIVTEMKPENQYGYYMEYKKNITIPKYLEMISEPNLDMSKLVK